MIEMLAVNAFCMSESVSVVDCDVRSDSVRAINVTLRSIATADENSTVPKNITSISGTMTANSVAASARLSATKSRAELRAFLQIFAIACICPLGSICLRRVHS